jgi:hypothetical protein
MSATATAARGAQAAAKAERSGWLDSLKSEAVSFLKGDNNAPWAILAETVIGCVPILGQIVDARDIIKGLVEVAGAPASPLAWFNLITALIGLIPGGGDAVKRSLRSIKVGATHVDDLLAMIRKVYKGDPEKLLKETLDVSKLRKTLDDILTNPRLTDRLSPEVKQSIEQIRSNLGKQFDAFKMEVDNWLAKGRKTSADGPPSAKSPPATPSAKPETHAKGGTQEKAPHSDPASVNTPNAASQRTTRFKTMSQKVLGVLGEHMADFHCQDVKGWGEKVAHDQSLVNTAKLNDSGRMVQLWPVIARGRGIDAVWRSGGPKPYAIIEAKASYNPAKTLHGLLGEAGDKTERSGGSQKSYSGGGRTGSKGNTQEAPPIRQLNGKVAQMGHTWIKNRLQKAVGSKSPDWPILRDRGRDVYTRHVLFFSVPHAVSHAEALIKLTAQQAARLAGQPGMTESVPHEFHVQHEITREWGDAAIDKVVDNRAGVEGEARNR